MIGLSKGKRILDRLKTNGKFGSGFLYMLNEGLSFEVTGKGIVLELESAEIAGAALVKKEKFVISWLEGSQRQESKFKSEKAKEIVAMINESLKSQN